MPEYAFDERAVFDADIGWHIDCLENHPWLAAATCPIFVVLRPLGYL